jgi:hypothetical protein
MNEPPVGSTTPPSPGRQDGRLDSWKKIAAYLKRDASTVQRWERREAMPVHPPRPIRSGCALSRPCNATAATISASSRASRLPPSLQTPIRSLPPSNSTLDTAAYQACARSANDTVKPINVLLGGARAWVMSGIVDFSDVVS